MIGAFGDVVFEVTDKKIQTFYDFKRAGEARWHDHDIIGGKPKSEFNGPGLDEITFVVLLKAEFGINPTKQLEKLRNMRDQGKAAPFILGGKPISKHYFSIQKMSEEYKIVDNRGNIIVAEVELELKEYVRSGVM
ncbi:phage tail protein [Anoxybacillus sp. MB8]|uniref:phage tail protein n=1 Tax=Anoxybacillus sp. MB8 TaxID=2496850 RepID=UPI0013D179D4|nr:phage tail protein [Anoxybacillus sp. MB8]